VIASFGDKATEALFNGSPKKEFKALPPGILAAALRKLDMLNAAIALVDLRSPPGNMLEALEGDMAGLHSVRVNDQWRVVFRWERSEAFEVRITDYH
jgi:proteic killer suppression protein